MTHFELLLSAILANSVTKQHATPDAFLIKRGVLETCRVFRVGGKIGVILPSHRIKNLIKAVLEVVGITRWKGYHV